MSSKVHQLYKCVTVLGKVDNGEAYASVGSGGVAILAPSAISL